MATIALDATYTVDPNPSGVAVYSQRLMEALLALRTRHRFLLCYRLSRFGRRRSFLRSEMLPAPPGSVFSVRLMQEHVTFWLPWQADLFHSLAQRTPPFRFRKEVVTVIDIFPITGQDYSTPSFRRKFAALLLAAVERAALVITPSEYTSSELIQHSGVPKEKIRVVPLGVDPPKQSIPAEHRLRERERLVGAGNKMILSIGVIQTRKNTLNMLRALQTLPENYCLVLAGGDGYGAEAIHEFIRKERLGSRVRVLGYVPAERIPTLYQSASVFLFPSLEEGFGLPVLESMGCGLPVVVSRTSSLPEVGGEAALYVDPHDPLDIAARVREAVEDEVLRQRMVVRGLDRARDFSWRRTAEGNLRVYEEVLAM